MRAAIVPTTQELEQEKSMLRIAMTSTMGRGVFATRDIPGNTKVAVYPGFIYPPETVNADPMHSKYAWEMKMAVGTPGAQSIINVLWIRGVTSDERFLNRRPDRQKMLPD